MPDGKKKLSEFNPQDIVIARPKTESEESSSFARVFQDIVMDTQGLIKSSLATNPATAGYMYAYEKLFENDKPNYVEDTLIPQVIKTSENFNDATGKILEGGAKSLEGATQLGNLLASQPFYGFETQDQALRHYGMETFADVFNFPFSLPPKAWRKGGELIDKVLPDVKQQNAAIRLGILAVTRDPELAHSFNDEQLQKINEEVGKGVDLLSIVAAGGVTHKAGGLGKQVMGELKKSSKVNIDPYKEPPTPKAIPETTRDFKASEVGDVTKTLTKEEQISLGELKLGRDELVNERIYLQDKLKANRDSLKGLKGKEAVTKRKELLKDNTESIKRIKEIDEIVEYRNKEIDSFIQGGEVKSVKGALPESSQWHFLKREVEGKGENVPSNINFAGAVEPGTKTTTDIEGVHPVKRGVHDFMKDRNFFGFYPDKFVGKPTLDSGLLSDILKTAEESGVKAEVLNALRVEALKRNLAKEFDTAYQEAKKQSVKTEVKQQPVSKETKDAAEPKQITIKKTTQEAPKTEKPLRDYQNLKELFAEDDSKQITRFVESKLSKDEFKKLSEEIDRDFAEKGLDPEARLFEEAQKIVEGKPVETLETVTQKINAEGLRIDQNKIVEAGGIRRVSVTDPKTNFSRYLEVDKIDAEIKRFRDEQAQQIKKNENPNSQFNTFVDPKQIADFAKTGAEIFNKGYKSFGKWADEMKKTYGNEISPQLEKIWAMSKVAVKETKEQEKTGKQVGVGQGLKNIAETDRQTLYEQNRKVSKEQGGFLNKAKDKLTKEKDSIKKVTKTVLEPISTSIEKVSPEIFRKFRKFSFDYQLKLLGRHEVLGEYFAKQLKGNMPKEIASDFDLALKNGWMEDAHKIAKKYGFDEELNKVIKIKDELARELGVKTIENHFPRMVEDFEGFIEFLEKTYPDYYKDNFSRMIAEKSQRIGRKLTTEEQANLINNALRGYNPGISLSDVGNMRKRMIETLDGKMNQFYASSNTAVMRYINQMTELAEAKKFFGKGGFDINESIGTFIQELRDGKRLDIKGSRELMDVFKARFNQRTITSQGIATLRDIGVITKLGNPFSALTQLKDLAYSVYFSPLEAPKNFLKVTGSKLGVNEITWKIREMGIDPLKIAQELSDPRVRSKYVNTSLKASGFSGLDMIGKETLINTLWDKYTRQARQKGDINIEFERRIERYFGKGNEKVMVLDDLRKGKKTDRTAFLLYNELVGAQPISLAEMPRGFLTGGNWRVAYFLKTFAIRQLDFALNETVRVMRNPELTKAQKIGGGKNLFKLATSLALVGISVDTIKDWIKSAISGEKFNTEEKLGENAIDNLLNVILLSRYDYSTARREGLGEALGRKILPPVDFVNDPIMYGLDKLMGEKGEALKMTRNVPVIGQFIYEYFKKPKGRTGFNLNFNMPELPSL